MEKKDLKTGYIIQHRSGFLRTVIHELGQEGVLMDENGDYCSLSYYHNDLTTTCTPLDIVKVYRFRNPSQLFDYDSLSNEDCIWTRSEPLTRADVDKLYKLCMDINGLEKRKQSITGNKPTVFIYLYGHPYSAIVAIYANGWKLGIDGERYAIDLESDREMYDRCIKRLEEVLECMNAQTT